MNVALYLRVSTDEQAQRETIDAQRQALGHWTQLQQARVIDTYVDDGVSGALPFEARPEGKRLLDDLAARRFEAVVAFRVDRLARSLAVLMELYARLEPWGVAIRSATEPFDTTSPFGKFLFQFLGSMAELDKSNTLDRLTRGRDRVARLGKWTSGPVPFGYTLDKDRYLVPSVRVIPGVECTEAELVRELYHRIAHGDTMVSGCVWFNALKVPTERRYGSGKTVVVSPQWSVPRMASMLHNPVYKGLHVQRSKHGTIEREVPALVSPVVWERAQTAITQNLTKPTHGRDDVLLRGLVRCYHCGRAYVTGYNTMRQRGSIRYYRCNQRVKVGQAHEPRCGARMLQAERLEALVWEHCQKILLEPTRFIEEAQQRLSQRRDTAEEHRRERAALCQALAEKDSERKRLLTLYRRGRVSLVDYESELAEVEKEASILQARLRVLEQHDALNDELEMQLGDTQAILAQARQLLPEIPYHLKRELVQILVRELVVETRGTGRHKQAVIHGSYRVPSDAGFTMTTGC